MADGVAITAGSGTTIATDDCGAPGHVQVVKLAISADGSVTLVSADAANGMDVDVTRVIPGTTATALGKAEDAPHTSSDVGVMALTVRQDTAAGLTDTNADYQPLTTDSTGRLHVNPGNDLTQSASLSTSTTNAFTVGNGVAAVNLRIGNTWVGTVAFEGTIDGATWDPIFGLQSGVAATYSSVTEALNNNIFRFTAAGYSQVRVNFTRTSGTLDVFWRGSYNVSGVDQASPLPPGSNSLGAVILRRDQLRISVQSAGLTIATTAYSLGDQVGTQFTLANAARVSGGTGRIKSIILVDAADVIGAYEVVFFQQSITLASDNAAWAISDADMLHLIMNVPLNGAYDMTNNRIGVAYNLDIPYVCSGGTSLYASLLTRSNHGFFSATTNLQLIVFVERD
jgi:hypothetical protein